MSAVRRGEEERGDVNEGGRRGLLRRGPSQRSFAFLANDVPTTGFEEAAEGPIVDGALGEVGASNPEPATSPITADAPTKSPVFSKFFCAEPCDLAEANCWTRGAQAARHPSPPSATCAAPARYGHTSRNLISMRSSTDPPMLISISNAQLCSAYPAQRQ